MITLATITIGLGILGVKIIIEEIRQTRKEIEMAIKAMSRQAGQRPVNVAAIKRQPWRKDAPLYLTITRP